MGSTRSRRRSPAAEPVNQTEQPAADLDPGVVSASTEGLLARRLVAVGVVVALAIGAFVGGHMIAGNMEADRRGELAMPTDGGPAPAADLAVEDQAEDEDEAGSRSGSGAEADGGATGSETSDAKPETVDRPGVLDVVAGTTDSDDTDPAATRTRPGAEGSERLQFVAFTEPTTLIDGTTAAEFNNSIGIDTSTLGDAPTAALVVDLVVRGPGGTTVSVHPGDRPAKALRFTVPASGRLLVPHLIVEADEGGRVVVSADAQVEVDMTGLGRLVTAEQARAGRFVATDSVQLGSLVTATDGRTLVMALDDVLDGDASHVGQAVLRLNANVSQDGGSVTVGDGQPIPWPGPPVPDQGLAGTELLTVTPNEDGEIVMTYLGGSVMTVELVGYYTNDQAPASEAGLLVLSSEPAHQTIEVTGGSVAFDVGAAVATAGLDRLDRSPSRALVTVEVINGPTGGTITFADEPSGRPGAPAFALAPNQQRSSTEWLDASPGATTRISAPDGATVHIWTVAVATTED